MNRKFLFGSALGLVAGVGITMLGTFWTCRHWGPFSNNPDERAAWVVRRLSHELKLNSSQIASLNTIKDELVKRRVGMAPGRDKMHRAILAQVGADKVDVAALNQVFESRTGDMKETRLLLISKFAEFHSTLTPEQRRTLREKIEHFLENHDAPF